MKQIIRETMLWAGLILVSIIVGGTVYQMIVIVPEFSRDIPNGMIEMAHSHVSTKSFWTSPIQDLSLLALILAVTLNWRNKRRNWLLGSTLLAIISIALTIVFALPQLQIMGIIDGNPSSDAELLTQTIKSWIFFDQIRFWALIVPAFLLYIKAVTINVE